MGIFESIFGLLGADWGPFRVNFGPLEVHFLSAGDTFGSDSQTLGLWKTISGL